MKYKIEIRYQTGNSFGSENTSDVLELEWDDLDVAKENLQAIKDHYKNVYGGITHSYNSREKNQELCEEYKNKWWFVEHKRNIEGNMEYDVLYSSNGINLKTDDGTLMQMSCFWCGHFERLLGAKILTDESDMEFEM